MQLNSTECTFGIFRTHLSTPCSLSFAFCEELLSGWIINGWSGDILRCHLRLDNRNILVRRQCSVHLFARYIWFEIFSTVSLRNWEKMTIIIFDPNSVGMLWKMKNLHRQTWPAIVRDFLAVLRRLVMVHDALGRVIAISTVLVREHFLW